MEEQKGISRSPRELLEYNLLPLVGHLLMLTLALLFLWSNVTTFIHKSPTRIPEVQIPKDPVLECAQALRFEINCDFSVLQDIASGRDFKKILAVIASLWVLTLFYIGIAVVFTLLLPYKGFGFRVFFFANSLHTTSHDSCAIREI
ncbi:hypothetical protein ES332_D11G024300v1 [Gossypium tomentosum]|uniref:Reticulon-like protein n=1 Tax=Gossypium tomentosum TaxID=34277 RepID=A0A5D2IH19_GOSTO|nr:hypothetical protein ES332_D11G024300v1 [Gossypium tomentosum]